MYDIRALARQICEEYAKGDVLVRYLNQKPFRLFAKESNGEAKLLFSVSISKEKLSKKETIVILVDDVEKNFIEEDLKKAQERNEDVLDIGLIVNKNKKIQGVDNV